MKPGPNSNPCFCVTHEWSSLLTMTTWYPWKSWKNRLWRNPNSKLFRNQGNPVWFTYGNPVTLETRTVTMVTRVSLSQLVVQLHQRILCNIYIVKCYELSIFSTLYLCVSYGSKNHLQPINTTFWKIQSFLNVTAARTYVSTLLSFPWKPDARLFHHPISCF